jgi:hypothetical protein
MGKKAYTKSKLIPIGKVKEWIKPGSTVDSSNNDNDSNGSSNMDQKIDELILKLDTKGLKNKIREELKK